MFFFNVRHVSFDLWLTLIKSNPVFKQKRDELLKSFFKIPHPIDVVSARIRMWDLRFNAINESSGRNIDSEEIVLIILTDLDVDVRQMASGRMQEFYGLMEELFFEYHPVLYEERLPEYLSQLAGKGLTMSLLSNTGFMKGSSLKRLLDQLGIAPFLKFQIYSDEIAYSKPAREAYQQVLDEIARFGTMGPEAVLHIGDNAHADFRGAQLHGLQSALINSNQVSLLSLTINA